MRNNLETSSDEIIGVILFSLFWLTLELFGGILGIIMLIIISLFTFIIFLQWFIPSRIDSYIEELNSIFDNFTSKSFGEIYNIQEILLLAERGQNILGKAKILKYISYIWKSDKIKIITHGYADYIEYNILNNLIYLQRDLNKKIQNQQNSLESAKSEVEKNIQGTTELESVSELQRARLDRQIEQFEELQRVLVKV